jgi:transposase
MKVMMIVAFHKDLVAGYKILSRNKNVDNIVYREFLEDVILPYVQKHLIRHPLILHDNARAHKHKNIKAFFQRHRLEELKHPLYSPDLNPCDYDGIMRIKRPLKGKRFINEVDLETAYDEVIKDINLQKSAIGIYHLPRRWQTVIKFEGEYII